MVRLRVRIDRLISGEKSARDLRRKAAEDLIGNGARQFGEGDEAIGGGGIIAEDFDLGSDPGHVLGKVGEINDRLIHADSPDDRGFEPCLIAFVRRESKWRKAV